MQCLTKETINQYNKRGRYDKFRRSCDNLDLPQDISQIMLSIYAIESYYRPAGFRIIEYLATLFFGVLSIAVKYPMRNYTIGVCQLGLATISNYYGAHYYEHQPRIRLLKPYDLYNVMSVASLSTTAKILAYHIIPIYCRAQKIYPYDKEQQLYYIGEQFNGRYSYGLMLCETYEVLFC